MPLYYALEDTQEIFIALPRKIVAEASIIGMGSAAVFQYVQVKRLTHFGVALKEGLVLVRILKKINQQTVGRQLFLVQIKEPFHPAVESFFADSPARQNGPAPKIAGVLPDHPCGNHAVK